MKIQEDFLKRRSELGRIYDPKAAKDSRTPRRWRARLCAWPCRKVLECGCPLPLFGTGKLEHHSSSVRGYARVRGSALDLLAALIALLATLCTSTIDCLATEEPTQREYELKAAVLYHIIEYVEWPKEALADQPTLQLGLVGDIPFAAAIELLDGKTVQGRKLVVKRVSAPDEAARCQVLFIGASEKLRLAKIVGDVKNRPVLTVSEVEGFAERSGGMVNLVTGPNRIIMEINREAAGQAKLSLSSQLLRLAKVYPK